MRSLLLSTTFLASLLVPVAGCNLYFGGGNDDEGKPPCAGWGGGDYDPGFQAPVQQETFRNPQTGECVSFEGPPRNPCIEGNCIPCPAGEPSDTPVPGTSAGGGESAGNEIADSSGAPLPPWGACESDCTGLDEQTCTVTSGCRGIYAPEPSGGSDIFQECWATAQNPVPVPTTDCEGLDAYSCSASDDCIAVHEFECDWQPGDNDSAFLAPPCDPGNFLACHNEPTAPEGCYGDNDCTGGTVCNAADLCLRPPGSHDCDQGECPVLPAICYGYCIPEKSPGECNGEVVCDSLPPICPDGSTPGITNGCWSGGCIDLLQCPHMECGSIQSEALCVSRSDCSPYYVGDACTCDADGCTCEQWFFDSCSAP